MAPGVPDFPGHTRALLLKYKRLAEDAAAQVNDADFFTPLGPGGNSIALLYQHLAGNLRSRFTDFLTTDGEKPDRYRDAEFEPSGASREEIVARWEAGWKILFSTLDTLGPEDLLRTVTIRGEPHTAMEAILRGISHYSYHVGQIVLLAKYHSGEAWRTLSIPRRVPEVE